VDDGVNLCPHAVHSKAWTPLEERGTIVDMTLALAVIVAATALTAPPPLNPQHLPQLPSRGLARETSPGVELQTMRGRPLGVLRGLHLADDKDSGRGLLLRDRRGRLFVMDFCAHRVRRVFPIPPRVPGCRLTDARVNLELLVCGRTVKTALYRPSGAKPDLRVVARGPSPVGHWVRAEWAPRGKAFFAQWSAECEVPIAFLVANGVMHPYGGRTIRDAPSSVALGWLPDGTAVIHFPNGACGGSFRTPGIYAVPRTGTPRLLLRTPRFDSYWMWGG
jgi:hypothetical protein